MPARGEVESDESLRISTNRGSRITFHHLSSRSRATLRESSLRRRRGCLPS